MSLSSQNQQFTSIRISLIKIIQNSIVEVEEEEEEEAEEEEEEEEEEE